MSKRLLTGLTAVALVGTVLANDKKKAPIAPETTPAPTVAPALPEAVYVPAPVPVLPPPRPVEPSPVVVPPSDQATSVRAPSFFDAVRSLRNLALPSPHYFKHNTPQYFPAEPQFPLPRKLAHQEEFAASRKVEPAAHRAMTRSYSVGDLIVPLPKAGESNRITNLTWKTQEAELIKKIQTAIAPKTWKANGGMSSIEFYSVGMALVVNAPADVHEALAKHLDHIRQMNDLQIQVEIRVVTLSTEALTRSALGSDFLSSKEKPSEIRTRMRFLTGSQMSEFLLTDPDVNTLSAPRMAILNGQEGTVKVGQVEHFLTGVTVQSMNNALVFVPRNEPHETGLEVKVEGTVSADKRFIHLNLNGKARDVATRPVPQIPITVPIAGKTADGKPAEKVPFTQFIEDPKFITRGVAEAVTVPDGGTVVFYAGKADLERKIREKMPLLADVPVFAELFTRDRKETTSDHMLIFATPRIINPHAGTEECEAPCCGKADKLGQLMAEYAKACKDGKSAEALKLAVECLAIDPTCFGKK